MKLPAFLRNLMNTQGEISPAVQRQPLFVSGCMRSGTSFLYNKLSEHPQLLKIGAELNDVWTEVGGADCSVYCEYKDEQDANYTFAANMNNYFFQFVEESKGIKRHLMRWNDVMNKQGGRVFYDWDNIVPVNKSTHLVNKLGYVHALFPKSKIIFIVRDIYGQSASLKVHFQVNHEKSGVNFYKPLQDKGCWTLLQEGQDAAYANQLKYPGEFKLIPEMWLRLNSQALATLAELPKDQVLLVNYEQLTKNQPAELRRIFDFLQLEKEHQAEEQKVCSKQLKYINTTTSGDPLEKWRSTLEPSEINAIEEVISSNKQAYDAIRSAINYAV